MGAATPASGSFWAPSRWTAGQSGYGYQPLPLLAGEDSGSAEAVNEDGEMVGRSDAPTPPGEPPVSRAVYWPADGLTAVDLNTLLLPADSDRWVLSEAGDINNSGQIVGSGLLDGVERGFVLDLATLEIAPVPLATGATWNKARQINDAGHVIGRAGPFPDIGSWGFYWGGPGTSPQLLPSTKDGAAFALGINNLDELAGKSTIAGLSDFDGKDYEFMSLWEPNATGTFTVTDLGTQIPSKPVWYLRSGEGINDDLWIVGIARKSVKGKYSWHGVLLAPNP